MLAGQCLFFIFSCTSVKTAFGTYKHQCTLDIADLPSRVPSIQPCASASLLIVCNTHVVLVTTALSRLRRHCQTVLSHMHYDYCTVVSGTILGSCECLTQPSSQRWTVLPGQQGSQHIGFAPNVPLHLILLCLQTQLRSWPSLWVN